MCEQLPNVVGLTFGIVQITLYLIYRNSTPVKDEKLPEHKGEVVISNEIETVDPARATRDDEKKIEVSVDIEIVNKKEEKQDEEHEEKKEEQVTEVKNEKEKVDVSKSGCEV